VRQADIIDSIRELVVGASIDASPENYEICHRFVTRSDAEVYEAFKQALNASRRIDAKTFSKIRDQAKPRSGTGDLDRQAGRLEEQISLVMGATQEALGHTKSYSQALRVDADRLESLNLGTDAAAIIAGLLVRTKAMTERSKSLEASLASAGSELSALRSELEKARGERSTDALTALPNRRAFDNYLCDVVTRAGSSREPLSLAFFDIDHFKQFNDTWGHQLGDHVLRYVGAQMASQFKDVGMPARFGGEEFVVALPGYGSVDALQAVVAFCDAVSARVLRVRSDGREIGNVTLSAGVATLRRGEDAESFVERADAAMYAAKRAGRNRAMAAA
jgi:diguanylate cyclase